MPQERDISKQKRNTAVNLVSERRWYFNGVVDLHGLYLPLPCRGSERTSGPGFSQRTSFFEWHRAAASRLDHPNANASDWSD